MTLAVLLSVAFLAGVALNEVARQQRLALIEQFDDLGIGELTPPDRQEDEIAAAGYLLATLELSKVDTPWDDATPGMGTRYDLEHRQALPEDMLIALRQTAPLREQLAALLDAAAEHPLSAWTGQETLVETDGVLSGLADRRRVARRLAQGLPLAQHEDNEETIRRTFQRLGVLSESFGEGLLFHDLVDRSIQALAVGEMEELLSRGKLSDQTLTTVGEVFERWSAKATPGDLDDIFRRELASVRESVGGDLSIEIERQLDWYRRAQHYAAWVVTDHGFEVADPDYIPPTANELRRTIGIVALFPDFSSWGWTWQAQESLENYADFVVHRDDRERLSAWSFRKEKQADDESIGSDLKASVRAAISQADGIRVALTALRVERFRVREGRWPGSLAEAHDGETPTDWLGRELLMRVVDGDAWIYAVGKNGRDDGGRSSWYFDDATEDEDDFHLFRLYAPSTRGALPSPVPIEP